MEHVLALINDDLQKLEGEFKKWLASQVPLITEVAEHLVLAGGKRFRPALLLLSSRLCGYTGRAHIILSGVIEFIHAATLLHDDVIDKADVRRGSASANSVWGNETSVLVGDFLYCRALAMMVEVNDMRILEVMAQATTALTEGETMELVMAGDFSVTEDQNLELIMNKTAVLIASSARFGAILGKADSIVEETLADYGFNVGIAFQLVDDCLDYVGDKTVLGKPTYSDLSEGKITLPLIHTLSRCTPEERDFLSTCIQGKSTADDEWDGVTALIAKYDGIAYALGRAKAYIGKAKASAQSLPACQERDALIALADYVVNRSM
jgi:octaprenyl-diphosphate synthase